MKKVLLVFGTRPEAIKMCPLVRELKKRTGIKTVVCVTAQHRQMLDTVLTAFDVTPDYDLDIMHEGQSLFDITSNVLGGIRHVLEAETPDLVLVQGDTTTAYATALACFYMQIPVAHVEAGLRTYNICNPYPEEFNRRSISLISKYHFAPTEKAKQNLLSEGTAASSIFVTGNTVIDALKSTVPQDFRHPLLDFARGSRLVIITSHRRESVGKRMLDMLVAVRDVIEAHQDVKAICPVHPNPAVRSQFERAFEGCEQICITPPLDVTVFHGILSKCHLIISDSGGIQEEASALGKPVIVVRDATERTEGIDFGNLRLTGTAPTAISREFSLMLDNETEYAKAAVKSDVYGDGNACERIADTIENLI